jgi:hypothetical protein
MYVRTYHMETHESIQLLLCLMHRIGEFLLSSTRLDHAPRPRDNHISLLSFSLPTIFRRHHPIIFLFNTEFATPRLLFSQHRSFSTTKQACVPPRVIYLESQFRLGALVQILRLS